MLDFSKADFMFNTDEKVVLNRLGMGVSKEECLSQLSFSEQASNDEDCKDLLQDVLDKVNSLSNKEWEDLQKYLPFEVEFSDSDMLLEELDNLQEE